MPPEHTETPPPPAPPASPPLPPSPFLSPLLDTVLGVGADLDLAGTLRHIETGAAEVTGARHARLDLTDPARDGLPDVRATVLDPTTPDPTAPALDVPIHVDGRLFARLRLTGGTDDRALTPTDTELLRLLAAQAGIAIGNARRYTAARHRERWIEGSAAVTTALLTGASADALRTVAEQARVLADAAAGVILQATAEGGMEIVVASAPADPGDIVGATIEPGSPVLVQLLGGEPVFIDDSATDPRMTTHVRHRFGPSMMLPLQAGGRLIGTLALPRARGERPYTDVERLLAVQFASQAALALVLADTRHRQERLAVYEDRDRIARDLHDLVVQRLFATAMMLESVQRRASATAVHDTLGRAVDELHATIQEVRTTIYALQQPPAEAPTTLRGKVLRETATAAALLGFPPSVRFTGPIDSRVPASVAAQLLTVLHRALTTATTRHPPLTRVEISLDTTTPLPDGREAVHLTVRDDGDGARGGGTDWQSPL
ncbi:GAF domain-containing protein [Streptomyces sp. NPDC048290]|uniref:sensor histidine kinase n=1 Tax=Streptomyces sp. NPDC048290 TaxID=3155811 RepID=UPI0034488D96